MVNLISSVKYILKNEKKNFDLLMFVGHLPKGVNHMGLIKVPHSYEPKHFYMTGKIIDKGILNDETFFNIHNCLHFGFNPCFSTTSNMLGSGCNYFDLQKEKIFRRFQLLK